MLAFARYMLMRGNPNDFKHVWFDMVENLGLQGNCWVNDIYWKQKRWVEAYLCEHFFVGIKSTQRCA